MRKVGSCKTKFQTCRSVVTHTNAAATEIGSCDQKRKELAFIAKSNVNELVNTNEKSQRTAYGPEKSAVVFLVCRTWVAVDGAQSRLRGHLFLRSQSDLLQEEADLRNIFWQPTLWYALVYTSTLLS